MDLKELESALKKPFRSDEIEWRISAKNKDNTKGLVVPYITNRAIQNRLDEVVGFDNWKNEFFALSDKSKVCGISIRFGTEWLTKYDGADDTNIEATKGGLSNAMKRAAVQWGIGRYLYNLPPIWAKIKPQGKSFVIDEVPKLPNWATVDNKKMDWQNEPENKLPENVQKCIDCFKMFNITQAELENYLHLEADMFTDKDIESLKNIWWQIKKGNKTKDDYFITEIKKNRSRGTIELERSLTNE